MHPPELMPTTHAILLPMPAGDSPYVRAKHVQVRGFFVLSYGLDYGFFLDSDLFELNCEFLLIWFLFVMKNFFLDFLCSLAFWNFLVLECY